MYGGHLSAVGRVRSRIDCTLPRCWPSGPRDKLLNVPSLAYIRKRDCFFSSLFFVALFMQYFIHFPMNNSALVHLDTRRSQAKVNCHAAGVWRPRHFSGCNEDRTRAFLLRFRAPGKRSGSEQGLAWQRHVPTLF